jgi:hypothetical protein
VMDRGTGMSFQSRFVLLDELIRHLVVS